MLQLKIVKGPAGVGRSFGLPVGKSVTIGRAEGCELRLPSTGVSKTHCRITALSGAKAEIEDLGSSNGTFVNGLLVKKHALKPGDTIVLSDFSLQIGIEIPLPTNAPATMPGSEGAFDAGAGGPFASPAATEEPKNFREKVIGWLEANLYPWADNLSSRFDVRALVGAFFAVWSVLIVLLTIGPFATRANERVRSESVQVARLYARQLVRINQQAVIDQRYRDLTTELDIRKGQTPGVLETMVLDAAKAQILAPAELIGRSLPNNYARLAIGKDEETVQYGGDGTAYVSAPIKIGTAEGTNRTIAVAFVVYNPLTAEFSFASLIDQATTSILFALILSIFLFVLLYRWIEGSLDQVSISIDEAIKRSETSVVTTVRWPALARVCETASTALSRAGGGSPAGGASDGAWAESVAANSAMPAAVFNSALTVTAWNPAMEKIIGIRANIALGADISGASRDVSFEAAIRELSAQAGPVGWSSGEKKLEFSGRFYRLAMVSGDGVHFVTITPVEE